MNDDVKKLNDAPVLGQLDDHWMKIVALLLHRFTKPGETVTFTEEQIAQLTVDWPHGCIVACVGGSHTLAFKLVTIAEAARLAAHNKTQQGNA